MTSGSDTGNPRGRPGGTLWLSGLPGAGKSTLAVHTRAALVAQGWPACVLDGDVLRQGLSSDLGLSAADRAEQARRAAHVAVLVSRSGVPAIVALVSPYAEDRQRAREIHETSAMPFFEIWVDTPLQVCEERDPKGLYAAARAGRLSGMTGIDAPYEPPTGADLRIDGDGESPTSAAERLVALLGLGVAPVGA